MPLELPMHAVLLQNHLRGSSLSWKLKCDDDDPPRVSPIRSPPRYVIGRGPPRRIGIARASSQDEARQRGAARHGALVLASTCCSVHM